MSWVAHPLGEDLVEGHLRLLLAGHDNGLPDWVTVEGLLHIHLDVQYENVLFLHDNLREGHLLFEGRDQLIPEVILPQNELEVRMQGIEQGILLPHWGLGDGQFLP